MINTCTIVGRLTKDPVLDTTQSGISKCTFTIACERPFSKEKKEADFIRCVAWRQSADFISKYARKGDVVGVVGRIQVTKIESVNGTTWMTEVVADRAVLCSSKQAEDVIEIPKRQTVEPVKESEQFIDITQEELPFY